MPHAALRCAGVGGSRSAGRRYSGVATERLGPACAERE
jgi:hypothetical protein